MVKDFTNSKDLIRIAGLNIAFEEVSISQQSNHTLIATSMQI